MIGPTTSNPHHFFCRAVKKNVLKKINAYYFLIIKKQSRKERDYWSVVQNGLSHSDVTHARS